MARIAGVNIPNHQHTVIGLQAIYGIGQTRAKAICVAAGVAESTKVKDLTDAEMENLRRRTALDVEKAHKFALEKFASELLPVLDNLERTLQVADKTNEAVKPLLEGVELTLKSMANSVAKFGVIAIDPQGQLFDPNLHQAMSMIENPDVAPNTVIAVMQKGYELNGRVIRPAMVMVSKAPTASVNIEV